MDVKLLAEGVIKKALNKGCDKAEVFIKTSKGISAEAKDGGVDALESSREFGIALKVIKNKRLGFSFTTGADGVEDMISDAVKGAEWTAPDEYIDIPEFMPASEALVMDEKMKDIKEDDIIKKAILLERSTLDLDSRINKVRKAGVSIGMGSTTIVNSKGVNISYESGYITAQVMALASDGQDSQMGWDFAMSRRMSDVDCVSVAQGASKRALQLLGARKISNVKVPVILDSSVAKDFLGIFSSSLSAEAVQKGRSFLKGKAGKKIISPLINIIDDGLIPWHAGTKPADDEGVPASRKVLVEGGVLTGFIHNTYTANKDGVRSTGNAVRGGFRGLPGVDVTNLYIERQETVDSRQETVDRVQGFEGPGVRGQDNNRLIKSLSKGLLILETMGIHTANPISGDFSIGVSGLWIEGGEIAYPVKEAVMSGNILELFNNIQDVGDDLRFYGKIGSPGLLTGEVDISA
ncbi:MAG: TldD/PmbA family protein [Nitrospirae bacterium]|nr:TldD/PmbA family protein [Nitrospirota bacterium]